MADAGKNSITVIKRKKVIAGGGHHGGAWKVAYADFVTAMMAFFLLMWLLNATTEEQRKGLADYFNPTVTINRVSGGGDGMFSGSSIFADENLVHTGKSATGHMSNQLHTANGLAGPLPPEQLGGKLGEADDEFGEIESLMRGDSGESTVEDDLLKQVFTKVTDEGLIIEIFDLPDSPLFIGDSAAPSAKLQSILALIAQVAGFVTNPVAISGHSGDRELPSGRDAFDVTAERAQFARRFLETSGMEPARIARLTGEADRRPAYASAPDFRNQRLEITLLRRSQR